MIRIWGRPTSLNSIKVLWCLDELRLDYTLELCGFGYSSLDDPAFVALNPNRMVPVIAEDGFVLWESHAILRYLGAKYGNGSLYPQDLQIRANADRWMDWMVQNIKYRLRWVFHNRYRPDSPDGDAKAAEKGLAEIGEWWQLLDRHLELNDYIAGEDFTIGDIPLGCAVYRYREMVPERPDMPFLDAWYQRLTERHAYKRHVMQPLA
ncbi:MAG: glutathione S-transferase [Rhodospirillaceae bacterium]|nr:glutathione S-transferase [Rhodospirillaceae bacterium]HAA91511.1 glutathione S-transferase [Rhodospirillaceae bacterium]